MFKWLLFAGLLLTCEAFITRTSRVHWLRPAAFPSPVFSRFKPAARLQLELQAAARLPPELAAELLGVDVARQDPNSLSRDFWDLALDPRARGKFLRDQVRLWLREMQQGDSSEVKLEDDQRFEANDFSTLLRALLDHAPERNTSAWHDPIDAPWRMAWLDVMKHVLLLKNYHLVDATWSVARLLLSVSKIESHEEIGEKEAKQLPQTLRLAIADRCPPEYYEKLYMHEIEVKPYKPDPKLLVLQKQFDEHVGEMVIVKMSGALKRKPVYIGRLLERQPSTLVISVQGKEVVLPTINVGEVRLPDAYLSGKEIAAAAEKKRPPKRDAELQHWIPGDEDYEGEIDPPHISPFNKTFEEQFPGMLNLRTDFEPVELLKPFNLTELLQRAKTPLQGTSHLAGIPTEEEGRKLTSEEIEQMTQHITQEQERIAKARAERALEAYRQRRARRQAAEDANASLPEPTVRSHRYFPRSMT